MKLENIITEDIEFIPRTERTSTVEKLAHQIVNASAKKFGKENAKEAAMRMGGEFSKALMDEIQSALAELEKSPRSIN